MSDLDDHAEAAEPPARDDDEPAVRWTRAFIAERDGQLAGLSLDDLLAAARDADIDEDSVRQAIDTLGLKERRNGRLRRRPTVDGDSPVAGDADLETREQAGRRKPRLRDDSADAVPADDSRSERQSNRAPGGKVRIIAVDLDGDGEEETDWPLAIVVHIRCDEPGRLNAHLLVRDGQEGEAEAVPPELSVSHPGSYTLRCEVPADALGGLKHVVDVEAWLATADGSYASMDTSAQRFKAPERGRRRPFGQLGARWSEDIA